MRIVPDGIYYACALTLAGLALSYFLNPWVGLPLYVAAAFCLYFFRDPERKAPSGNVMVAPADGKVVAVRDRERRDTRQHLSEHLRRTREPHADSGHSRGVVYQRGRFLNASHEAASSENEQNTLIVEGQNTRVTCRQIAGLIARRIVCFKHAGDAVGTAERIGYIKFGSRVDVIYGPEWKMAVKVAIEFPPDRASWRNGPAQRGQSDEPS